VKRLRPPAYLAALLAAVGAYAFLPSETWLQTVWQVLIGYAGAGSILVGVRRYRPAGRLAWILFAAGIASNATGIAVETLETTVFGQADAFPSAADGFYLALYPALALGLVLLVRRRSASRDLAALVDATTISTGLGLLSWVFLIHPAATDRSLGLAGHIVNAAYPVGDVVLLAMLVRLLLGGGWRPRAFGGMAGSLLLFLAGDGAWAAINQSGYAPGQLPQRLLSMVFLLAYGLFGSAALHPSMRELGEPAPARPPRLSTLLLALLTVASLIAPAILAVQVAHHRITDGVAIVVGSVALFLLVVTRMAQLLRQVEQQARQLLGLASEDELTGLANRRVGVTELLRALERARREGRPLSVAMIDLDHFKQFNDMFGHLAGDRLLRTIGAAWTRGLRESDMLARYGGDEFILLLPDADPGQAREVLERLQADTPAGQTLSAGVATWDAGETSDELIARADRALYEAKRAGRDRVVLDDDRPGLPAAVAAVG